MELRILGPLEVVENGRTIAIASERQRALLALLVVNAGRTVTTERILDALWGDEPPESGAGSVAFHVSKLRAALEPGRRAGGNGDGAARQVIATEPGGYALRVEPETIDATRFERLGREAHERIADDPGGASARASEALALWRGEPFGDLADLSFLRPEIGRLRELRLRMAEDLAEAELALGHARDVVGQLEALVAEEPLREHLRGLLMRALYAAGRQADALRVYQEGRRQLAEELGIDLSAELQALELAILRQDATLDAGRPTTGPRNPYKGLRPFVEGDAADFFGREALVDRLVDRLEAVARAGGLLLVVGPSGIGKSSVIRAGLVPRLRARAAAGGEAWTIATMLPGARPEEALMRALEAVVAAGPAPTPSAAALRDDDAIATTLRRAAVASSRLLVVIDQFEELFALAPDPAVPARFLRGIAQALTGPEPRPVVVAALRADWFDRPLLSAELGVLVRGGSEIVAPLTHDELERAIVRPAAAVGVQLEPGLAPQLVADVADRPGALPLLQFALTELFERAGGRNLTRESYAAIGGVAGAVGRRAEAVFAELDDPSQALARQLLLRLVAVGEGRPTVARRVVVDELRSLDPEPERVDAVLEAFARPRLLAFDRDPRSGRATVELAHEALLTHWARLEGWSREAQEALWIEGRLKEAAGEWSAADRDPGFLLSGGRLDMFSAWAATTDLRLDSLERELLEASLAEQQRAESAERERRDQERRLERRAATRLRALVVVLLAAVVGAAGLLAVVWSQSEGAREDQEIASARELAVASSGALDADPTLGLLLAVESARATAGRGWIAEEAMDALHWAVQAARVPYPSDADPVAVRDGPDGRLGVYLMPAAELVDLAARAAGRALTTVECQRYLHVEACPASGDWAGSSLAVRVSTETVPADRLATGSLAGSTVRVASQLPADLGPLIAGFGRDSGIAVETVSADDLASLGDTADIAILARPDDVATLGEAGQLLDLDALLDPMALRADVAESLTAVGQVGPLRVGSQVLPTRRFGFPVAVSLSGLLWYPAAAFHEAGYEPPRSWVELQTLTAAIAADGRTPWCLGVEDAAGRADLADWLEDLLLGTDRRETYENWARARVSLDGGPTAIAIHDLEALLAVDGAVRGGLDSAFLTSHAMAGLSMSTPRGPGCWLQHGAGTLPASWPATVRGQLSFIPMPAVDPGRGDIVRGRVYTVVARHDRPEVRALLAYLVGGAVDAAIARDGSPAGLLPLGDVNPTSFPAEIGRAEYRLFRAARSDHFALDATDRMPATLGEQALPDGLAGYLQSGEGPARAAALDRLLKDLEAIRGGLL